MFFCKGLNQGWPTCGLVPYKKRPHRRGTNFVIQRQLFRCQKGEDFFSFFLEIDPSLGQISEVVAQREGDPLIQNHMCNEAPLMWPSAPLLIYANWPPEAHEFDIPAVYDFARENVVQ